MDLEGVAQSPDYCLLSGLSSLFVLLFVRGKEVVVDVDVDMNENDSEAGALSHSQRWNRFLRVRLKKHTRKVSHGLVTHKNMNVLRHLADREATMCRLQRYIVKAKMHVVKL